MTTETAPMPLGIPGFRYPDLHQPARLRDLYDLFCRGVADRDPELWTSWEAYRANPDAPRPPVETSDLLVRMAPHVSRFVATLFGVESAAGDLVAATNALDPLFRFKIDFVRKRALPLTIRSNASSNRLVLMVATPPVMAASAQ